MPNTKVISLDLELNNAPGGLTPDPKIIQVGIAIGELHQQLLNDIADLKQRCELLMCQPLITEDEYPSDECLEIVKIWHWSDPEGWFEFIESVWNSPGYGFTSESKPHPRDEGKMITEYRISTTGWSGNEAIIAAMQENAMMWTMFWQQSRRGGHYIFDTVYKVKM